MNKDMGDNTNYDMGYNYLDLLNYAAFRKPGGTVEGSINYFYDAAGNRVKKTVNETGQPSRNTLYINNLVFQDDVLQFIGHEEGRFRFTPATGSTPARFDCDYFIKDNLSNIRMVLTEEQQQVTYPVATLEGNPLADGSPNAVYREQWYYTINTNNIVDKPSGLTDYPNNNGNPPYNNNINSATSSTSTKMYQLEAISTGAATGLGISLKVMSGDKIDIFGKSYYQVNNTATTNHGLLVKDLLAGFLGAPSGAAVGKGVTATGLDGIPAIAGAIGSFLTDPNRADEGDTKPKAYINYVLLDEQFRYAGGGFSRVGDINTLKDHYSDLQNINITKNGYLYVYCSNESPVKVFIDNLQVIHTKGPILEEAHYYPYGLKIAGISSKAAFPMFSNSVPSFGYQGDFSEEANDFGINYNEFALRNYDAQIGRWTGADPYDQFPSPYMGMGNDPVNNIDEDGGWSAGLAGALTGAIGGGVVGYLVAKNNGASTWGAIGAGLGGAFVGGGLGFGIEKSLAGNGPVSMNARAFYKGLFGGEGYTYAKFDPLNRGLNFAEVPDIWGGLGSINFKLPRLFDWVPSTKIDWQLFSSIGLTTNGWSKPSEGYDRMTRKIRDVNPGKDNGYNNKSVEDNFETEVEDGPNYRTKLVIKEIRPGVYPMSIPDPKPIGGKLSIKISQLLFTDYLGNSQTENVHSKAGEVKFKINTYKKTILPVKKLKILGIKMPIFKR